MVRVGLFALLVACNHGSAAAVDAQPDAYCTSDIVRVPMTVSGTSPAGPLDGFHYASAGFVTGFCMDSYLIDLAATASPCDYDPWLQLVILAPFNATGTNHASIAFPRLEHAQTDNVTFEATQLDMPAASPAHIRGHFVSHDPAWSFDLAVDLISQSATSCI